MRPTSLVLLIMVCVGCASVGKPPADPAKSAVAAVLEARKVCALYELSDAPRVPELDTFCEALREGCGSGE